MAYLDNPATDDPVGHQLHANASAFRSQSSLRPSESVTNECDASKSEPAPTQNSNSEPLPPSHKHPRKPPLDNNRSIEIKNLNYAA